MYVFLKTFGSFYYSVFCKHAVILISAKVHLEAFVSDSIILAKVILKL